MSSQQVDRLVRGAELLISDGDYSGYRLASWIAFILTESRTLDIKTRMRLARVAGDAGELGDTSLAVIAARVIDPTLRAATADSTDVDIGELEELNFLRQRLNVTFARPRIRAKDI
jgi:hypothetical protein